ncbi:dynein heavy chain 8, axonemal, partial [Elysia marginata]
MANEARDNAKYLYTLEKYCEPLYRCQPLAMIDKLAGLLGTIRLIYNYSHYYYSTAKVSSILVKITSQIVTSCKSYISDNGESNLWLMPKNMLMTRLQNCIKLFQTYINLYQITKKKIAAKKTERPFDFSEMYIFGKIFTFRTRIEKIIMMLTIDKEFSPLEQCSVEGMDVHAARFASLLNNLRKKGFDLLNYRNMAFDDDFDKFLELVDDLKAQLQKFMNLTLVDLKHSLDRLDMMNRFSALNLSFLDIEEGYMNILNIYSEELEHMMQIYERDKEDPAIPWNLPPISGRIYWVRHMLNHIAEPLFKLQKSRPSVMKTAEGKRVTYRYNKFAFVLAKTEVLYHVAWFKSLDAASDCLQVPILARHPVTKETLINFDPYVFEVVKEAFYMVKLGLPVPRVIINIIHACTNITTTYRKLQMMLHEYNKLKDAIPEMFWPLMQPSIFKIDGLFYPAYTSITWTSLEIPAFFKELEKAFREMGLFIKTVCDVKYTRIDAKLNQIADTQMCTIPSTEPWTVEEFIHNTKENSLMVGEDLNKMNKMICDTVYELLRFFVNNAFQEYKAIEIMYAQDQKIADHESKKTLNSSYVVSAMNTLSETGDPDRTPLPEDLMTRESYVESCMALFEDLKAKIIEALIKGVRVSLSQLRKRFLSSAKILPGEDDSKIGAFFSVDIELAIPNIEVNPKMDRIIAALNRSVTYIVEVGKRVEVWQNPNPNIFSKLVTNEGAKADDEALQLKRTCFKFICDNKDVMKYNTLGMMAQPMADEVKKAVKQFGDFSFIWQDDRAATISEFLKINPGVYEFREKYTYLKQVEDNVANITPYIPLGPIALNTEPLKKALQKELNDWKKAYGLELKRLTKLKVDEMTEYMSNEFKLLNKPIKDLDDVRLAMEGLTSVKENYIRMDEEMIPIEEAYLLMANFELHVPKEETDKADSLRYSYEKLLEQCGVVTDTLVEVQPKFKGELTEAVTVLTQDISSFIKDYDSEGPMEPGIPPALANERLQNFQMHFDDLFHKHTVYSQGEELFGLPKTEEPELMRAKKELNLLQKLYGLYSSVMTIINGYNELSWSDVDCEKINAELVELQNRCKRLPKGLKDWSAYNELKKKIDDFNETVPLLELMANKAMQGRHWQRIQNVANYKFDFDVTSDAPMDQVMENVHLKDIMNAPLLPVKDDVEDICISAVKEKDIEAKLRQVMADWTNRVLTFMNFKSRGELLLKPADTMETIGLLEDSLMILSSLMSNRYNAPYKSKIQTWTNNLSVTADILEQWIVVQNLWVYLEAVFVGGDIAKQLPQESKRFAAIDKSWMKVMQRAHETNIVIQCCAADDTMQQVLPQLQEQLELCQKSLTGYLEKKRLLFPRFFFVSDPSLLEILGQASDCHTIQAHLLGLFDNIKSVEFHEKQYDLILACVSREGEKIELRKPVRCEGHVEQWLDTLMNQQQSSLHSIIREVYRAITAPEFELYQFLNSFQAQVGLLGIQFIWTKASEDALKVARFDRKYMINANNYFLTLLNMLISKTTENLSWMERIKYETLITIHVHQRDIFDDLTKRNITTMTSFDWLKQARFYFNEETDIAHVDITDVVFIYQNEYLGCTDRLVITPLTDRCYITLAQALWMSMGGAPAGPAGTGKTETTKDMGRCLGKYVVVFNCSDQMDFRGLGRIYKGLAQAGAWGCFDEFNRIELPVLSVAAQQIYIVLSAKKDKKKEFIFTDGDHVSLNPEFGIFLTMNPGYAGRQELPENLKVQFRTVSMMVPDRQIIMRVKLASCGFIENIVLAQKFFTLYKLCEEQLSKQVHYDFGLRNILSVLRTLGAEKRQRVDDTELTIVMRVLRDMNLSKLVDEDEPLFLSLIADLFPGISLDSANYADLQNFLSRRIEEAGLINFDSWNLKIVQLFETQRVRHGIMTLGPSGTGKTCCIRVLMNALKDLGAPHREMRMNPKAITAPQMFGRLDAATNDWTDGIFSTLWRRTLKLKKGEHCWLILDGPVDAVWIENLNSVLDDNKTLTLANGDRIPMAPLCKILFEVHNIDNASPATVSRNGMIFISPSVLPWQPILEGWLLKRSVTESSVLTPLFEAIYSDLEQFVYLNTDPKMDLLSCNKIRQVCDLLEGLIPASPEERKNMSPKHLEHLFIFSLMWSLGALLELDDRLKMQEFMRKHKSKLSYPKLEGEETIFEFLVAHDGSWVHWRLRVEEYIYPSDSVPLFSSILVPNVDNVRTDFLIETIAKQNKGVLLIGEQGTAKTVMIQAYMSRANPEERIGKSFNFSSASTPGMFQRTIESYVEKRVGTTYGPPGGKTMTVFVDDINMPIINEWGDQVTNEITRQMMEMKGMYSLDKPGDFLNIVDISFMAAMIHPGGGRNDIPERLKRQFCIFNCTLPSNTSIDKIFGIIGEGYFCPSRFDDVIVDLVKRLVPITRVLWQKTKIKMLPTPAKFHYIFNLRDLSRIWQGILYIEREQCDTEYTMINLWKHEVCRVIEDRFINEEDKTWFQRTINQVVEEELSPDLAKMLQPSPHFVDFMREPPEEAADEEGGITAMEEEIQIPKIYEQIEDYEVLRKRLLSYQRDFNENIRGTKLDLVFFKDAMIHLMKISRIVRTPRGAALLVGVGGSGKQSLTRLASYVAGYSFFQITITKAYNINNLMDDLKYLYRVAGKDGHGITFIFTDNEIKDESYLEYINNVLSSGEISNLFARDEIDEITSELVPVMKKEFPKRPPTQENLYDYFMSRARANLHIVLCFSPVGNKFRGRSLKFPGLISGCTMDWFSKWPREALVAVSQSFLGAFNMEATPEVKANLIELMGSVHDGVALTCIEYFDRFRRQANVTPKSYLSFLEGYKSLYDSKVEDLKELEKKMNTGLEKLAEATESVDVLSKELTVKEKDLEVANKAADKIVAEVTVMAEAAEKVKASVQKVKDRAQNIVDDIAADRAVAETKLEAAKPALEAAEAALQTIKPADISTVKKLGKPPHLIMRIMDCCLILFRRKLEPNEPDPDRPCPKPCWSEALKLMGQMGFLQQLMDFPKDTITGEMVEIMEPYMRMDDYNVESAQKVAGFVAGLLSWTTAMAFFYGINKEVLPLKANLAKQEVRLKVATKELSEAQATLDEKQAELNIVQAKYDAAMGRKKMLMDDAEMCRNKMEAATTLIGGLAGEQVRWSAQSSEFRDQITRLTGDVLICTGFLSYSGPFNQEFRTKLINKWSIELTLKKIPFTKNLNTVEALVDTTTIGEWNMEGLPNDDLSVQNGIITTKASRYPLLIDPQGQGKSWIKSREKKRNLLVTCLNHKYFRTHLEDALSQGRPLLIENVEEDLDPSLDNILEKNFIKSGSMFKVKVGDKECDVMKTFYLYITTKLANPTYTPEVSARTSIIDFTVTQKGLEDQLLGRVIVTEKYELEEERSKLVYDVTMNKRRMKELEENLLWKLTSIQGSLVDDPTLIEVLQTTKKTAGEVSEKLAVAAETEIEINTAREEFRPVASRGSILYFLLCEMVMVNRMYSISLNQFLVLFDHSMSRSKPHPQNQKRIANIIEYLTYEVWCYTSRSLYNQDRQLFTLLLAMKIDLARGAIKMNEFQVFIKGGAALDLNAVQPKPARWISDITWLNLVQLSTLPAFTNILTQVTNNDKAWRNWFDKAAPEEEIIPENYSHTLEPFYKLLLIRSWCPDRTSVQARKFIGHSLGQKFTEAVILDLEEMVEESNCRIPLIALLSMGSDPTNEIEHLAKRSEVQFHAMSMGQGQEVHARKLIGSYMENGGWALLQNCHLCLNYLDEVLTTIVETENCHKHFRLWITTEVHDHFSIGLLQISIKFTNDPPQGIKAGLKRTYTSLSQEYIDIFNLQQWRPLLYTVSFLHTVVQERRKFGPLGWNIPYEFNSSDWGASVQFIQNHLDDMDIKRGISWPTVRYMIGEVQYGGRVTDDFDKRLLNTFTR